MRTWPLAAALAVFFLVPPVQAASGPLTLEGPESLRADTPVSRTLRLALALDRVACTRDVDIPVQLAIADQAGLRLAVLGFDEVRMHLRAADATTTSWRADAIVDITIWAQDPTGFARVVASYALPSDCVALDGPSSGTATHIVRVEGPTVAPTPETLFSDGESVLAVPPPPPDDPSLPLPVLGSIGATLVGGLLVVLKRARGSRT